MSEDMTNKRRLSVQLNKDEEWILEKAHFLAEGRRTSLRDVILGLVQEGLDRHKDIVSRIERVHAEIGKVKK